jgi:hypothetical protein
VRGSHLYATVRSLNRPFVLSALQHAFRQDAAHLLGARFATSTTVLPPISSGEYYCALPEQNGLRFAAAESSVDLSSLSISARVRTRSIARLKLHLRKIVDAMYPRSFRDGFSGGSFSPVRRAFQGFSAAFSAAAPPSSF